MYNIEGRENDINTAKAEDQGLSESRAEALTLNWLEGHARIMSLWLDRLVSENGDIGLIDTVHKQNQWLQQMTFRLSKDP